MGFGIWVSYYLASSSSVGVVSLIFVQSSPGLDPLTSSSSDAFGERDLSGLRDLRLFGIGSEFGGGDGVRSLLGSRHTLPLEDP